MIDNFILYLTNMLLTSSNQEDYSSLQLSDEDFIKTIVPTLLLQKNRHLQLCENYLTDASISAIVDVMLTCQSLETLALGENDISDQGLMELGSALPEIPLGVLVLNSNEITDKGILDLCKFLPHSHLDTLDLSANHISDAGAEELAKILPRSNLISIDLSNNRITNKGGRSLALAMRKSNITTLGLSDNLIASRRVLLEIETVEKLVRSDFKIMSTLASALTISRLGVNSFLRVLPNEVMRRIAPMLYFLDNLNDLEKESERDAKQEGNSETQ